MLQDQSKLKNKLKTEYFYQTTIGMQSLFTKWGQKQYKEEDTDNSQKYEKVHNGSIWWIVMEVSHVS